MPTSHGSYRNERGGRGNAVDAKEAVDMAALQDNTIIIPIIIPVRSALTTENKADLLLSVLATATITKVMVDAHMAVDMAMALLEWLSHAHKLVKMSLALRAVRMEAVSQPLEVLEAVDALLAVEAAVDTVDAVVTSPVLCLFMWKTVMLPMILLRWNLPKKRSKKLLP